ncbi:MAG: TerB family tellurite resistance protein [Alphaproteobacteria bacterium]
MLSTKMLGTGTIIMVLGVFLIGSYMFGFTTNPMASLTGWFMAFGGFIFMMLGFFSLAGGEFGKKDLLHAGDSSAFSVALIRCMVAISIADEHLDDSEITEIARIYKHLLKVETNEETIRNTADEMLEYGVDIKAELSTTSKTLNKELKEKLITASLLILAADGDMDEGELIMLDDIRLGLGMSLSKLNRIKAKFLSRRELNEV